MLAGFQGRPWPLVCMGPPEAHGSEMCVFLTGSGTYGEEEMWAEREMGAVEVLFLMTSTGSSATAPVNCVIDFSHAVDSRASPRREGCDTLTSDGCLNIITLKQAEQEEMEGVPRTGTTHLPAFLLGPLLRVTSEKGSALRDGPKCRDGL